VRNSLANGRFGCKLSIGMHRVCITRHPRIGYYVGFRDGAPGTDRNFADYELIDMFAWHFVLPAFAFINA
jgi:hypothetical protein